MLFLKEWGLLFLHYNQRHHLEKLHCIEISLIERAVICPTEIDQRRTPLSSGVLGALVYC